MNPALPTSPVHAHTWAQWPYPRMVAHRGAGKLAPENTLAALRKGAGMGFKMVEFDAKLSADNVVFLLHDDSVQRTSNGHGLAAQMTYAELKRLDAGSWLAPEFAQEHMPTLAEVAQACQALGLCANVEIKPCPGREQLTGTRVAQAVRELWPRTGVQPLLSSFSYEALQAAAQAAPDLPRGMLYEGEGAHCAHWQEHARTLQCVSLHTSHRGLSEAQVKDIRNAGLHMLVYTVNDPERARELAHWGVNSICTDRIDLMGPDFLG